MSKTIFVIDGDNVAIGEDGKASIARIQAIHNYLSRFGETITVVGRKLRGRMPDQIAYEKLFRDIPIYEAPTGEKSDETILLLAESTGGIPISNDRFREYEEELGHITVKRIGFSIAEVQDKLKVIIPQLRKIPCIIPSQAIMDTEEVEA